jgi:predicted ribosome quality control (RQC) complex YloA/Tae2 family protein
MKEKLLSDGEHIVWIGENAQDNWDIIEKIKQSNVIAVWFHVRDFPSAHIILKLGKKEKLSKQLINECAMICKNHSKYKNYPSIKIIYTDIKNISKGEDIGSVYTKKEELVII